MLTSIAGLGDPDTAALDKKYQRITDQMQARAAEANATLKPETIKAVITEYKKQDRYNDVKRGFKTDFTFAPGSTVSIPAGVADQWEEAGICSIVPDMPASKAA